MGVSAEGDSQRGSRQWTDPPMSSDIINLISGRVPEGWRWKSSQGWSRSSWRSWSSNRCLGHTSQKTDGRPTVLLKDDGVEDKRTAGRSPVSLLWLRTSWVMLDSETETQEQQSSEESMCARAHTHTHKHDEQLDSNFRLMIYCDRPDVRSFLLPVSFVSRLICLVFFSMCEILSDVIFTQRCRKALRSDRI